MTDNEGMQRFRPIHGILIVVLFSAVVWGGSAETNAGGGGCRPVPLDHRLEGDQPVLAERSILEGWRYVR